MPRVFLAINLCPEIKGAIAAHVQQLKREWPQAAVSWVRPENVHITVKFLGEVPAGKLNDIAQAVDHALAGSSPFEIEIAGTGAFPPNGTPRVLWIGIAESEMLSQLHENIEKELVSIGFPREEKPFHPHLTSGRVRAPAFVREVTESHRRLGFPPHRLPVHAVSVVESQLSRTGPTYIERSKHKLRAE